MASGLDMIGRLPAPRQQFVETVDGMSVDHPLQHVAQVGIRFDVIQLAGRDERRDDGPSMAAAVAAGEQVVLTAERDKTDRAFDRIGVELDAAIVQESASGRTSARAHSSMSPTIPGSGMMSPEVTKPGSDMRARLSALRRGIWMPTHRLAMRQYAM
jgi:hypothetical protein